MADQGFENRPPVIVLPHQNQPQLSQIMRRYVAKCFISNVADNCHSSNILSLL